MEAQTLPLLATAFPAAAATACLAMRGQRPQLLARIAEWAAFLSLAAAFASLAALLSAGAGTARLAVYEGAGLSVRLDVLSVTMLLLVSFIGWIVLRYARTYLQGEAGQGAFAGWMSAALASVLLLVQAGNLAMLLAAWILTSLFLQKLLLFYPDRPGAQRGAHKKFVFARLGDLTLAGAVALLWHGFGTADIATILDAVRQGVEVTYGLQAAAVLLGIAAMLKSAQFPAHGWLPEVMETPTPVSAFLHAGVVNAGGFLLIRFADVMLLSPGALAMLVMIGGFTAIFAGLAMLTQPAVKTSLAWSTAAQMGFMIMQCGLALFPLALLHIVAHSLYKAHSFLSSGTAVDLVEASRRPGPVAIPDARAVLRAFGLAIVIYAAAGFAFGFEGKSPQAVALGAILVFGVAYLIAQGLAYAAPGALTLRTSVYSAAAAVSYFALQWAAERMTGGLLPPAPNPGPLEWVLIVLAVTSFGAVALAQATLPLWAHHPAAAGLRVHLANGFYVNAAIDRALGSWNRRQAA
jgi:NAD(P)H-quinone oxidoreductase subunit 5